MEKTSKTKYKVAQFVVEDNEVSGIIKNALGQRGFELEIEPTVQNSMFLPAGEIIKVFRVEHNPIIIQTTERTY